MRSAGSTSATRRKTPPRVRPTVEGTEQRNRFGTYVLQDHLLANGQHHGRTRIGDLQALEGQWLEAVAGEDAPGASVPGRWAFVDTETTGLSGGSGTCAFLVGVGAIESRGLRVRLFFMRDYDEEAAMLHGLARHLGQFDALVTFNGKSFDGPLLTTRYSLKRWPSPLAPLCHVDLVHPARRVWSSRLRNCRLATLESAVLGFERRGDIPGALIPQRYFDFLRSGQAGALRPIFRHNVLDIASLALLALVLMGSYSAADRASLRHGSDLLGLGRWLRNTGEWRRARGVYRRAIRAGLPSGERFASLWELAVLERRAGNYGRQVRLLNDLVRVSSVHRVDALRSLAIHFEHRERDLERALAMTRRAQAVAPSDDLRHREGRLLHKIASSRAASGPTPGAAPARSARNQA